MLHMFTDLPGGASSKPGFCGGQGSTRAGRITLRMSSAPAEPTPADARPPFNVRASVYGLITVGAVLAAESASRETYGETVGAVALALILYWLADSYAELVAQRVREAERLTAEGMGRMLLHELPIVLGGAPPLVAVVIAWAAGAGLDTALVASLLTTAVAILVTEVVARVQADLSGRELVVQTFVGTALGLCVLGLRLVLH